MVGKSLYEHSFKQKDSAVFMMTNKKKGETCRQDPSLLFQRLLTVSKRLNMDEEYSFKYELCSYPTSLFDDSATFWMPNEPELAKATKWLSEIDNIGENFVWLIFTS